MPRMTDPPRHKSGSGHRPTAVGSYIFAGGFTLGVRQHFDVLCHLEETNYGAATARHNMPDLPIHVGLEGWPLEELAARGVDFCYGNSPCACWSVAGYSKTRGVDKKWRTDPRLSCTENLFSLLSSLRPRIWAWESVTQAFTRGREFVDELTRQALGLGYSVTYLLHDAQWLGLPQVRKRFFMVCHRVNFQPTEPSWGRPRATPVKVLQGARIGEACSGKNFTPIRQFGPELLARVIPGERLVKFWTRELAIGNGPEEWERNSNGTVKGRPSFGHFRLPLDRPGNTVVGYGIVHPTEHRWLSTEEMQVLSGFPATYHFTPARPNKRASEIARGVCPPVGEWLARAVAVAVKADAPVMEPTVTLVDYRKPPGITERLPVPTLEAEQATILVPAMANSTTRRVSDGGKGARNIERKKVSRNDANDAAANSAKVKAAYNGRRGAVARPQGIGSRIRELILEGGHTPEQIVEVVRAEYPTSRATVADVAWNRGRLRKSGELPAS